MAAVIENLLQLLVAHRAISLQGSNYVALGAKRT